MSGRKRVWFLGLMVVAWLGSVPLPTTEVVATPPGGGIPTIVPPASRPPVGRPPSGQFDWQGMIQGIMTESARRQSYRPVRPPTRVYREPQYEEPRYVQPRYVQPAVTPNALPEPNSVVVQVPALPSPLQGRVGELSTRCGDCYGKELADMVSQSLDGIVKTLREDGVDVAALEQQIEKLRQRMTAQDAMRELMPTIDGLMNAIPALQRSSVQEEIERVLRWITIRDAFLVLLRSGVRGQGATVPVAGIPTGVIWVLYDPLLPAGTGMVVNSGLMVCGTGGEGGIHVAQASAAEALGLPVGIGDPVPEMEGEEPSSPVESIVICLPKEVGGSVSYVINSRHRYSLEPGYKQTLSAGQRWVVEFDRGNRQGTARVSLTRGYWEFRIVNNRWDLVQRNFEVTIDNREGTQDFQYVTNNEVVTVKPGDTKTHSSSDPVIVKFDRGEGPESPSRKNLNKSGTYKVAVNTETNYLDLFAESESTPEPAAGGSG